jgi:hypothetical protein
MERDLLYEQNSDNILYDNNYKEDRIKCKNYELCNELLSKSWWDEMGSHFGNFICVQCHMFFGTWGSGGKGALPIIDDNECPICFEVQKGIVQPNCEHALCINCFKHCYYGELSPEPLFPYPNIQDEYYNDIDDNNNVQKWNDDYPLIKIYHIEWNKWNDSIIIDNNLSRCSLCRK